MSRKAIFKKKTLLLNLHAVIERIPQLDIPANIVAVYAFGGMLRDKERLHDFDLMFLYSMTLEQELRWNRFFRNFLTYDTDSGREPLSELHEFFEPFEKQGVPLRDAIKDNQLHDLLLARGIPPDWAGCFSWTDIFGGLCGVFAPDLAKVIRRMLIGKRLRGLQVFVEKYQDFIDGKSFMAPKNYVLAWSPQRPNIEENIEGRSPEERLEYVVKELDLFIKEKIPEVRNGRDMKGGYLAARDAASAKSIESGLRIDFDALDKEHVQLVRTGNESYAELLQKCESARDELRKYDEETVILHELANSLQHWIEMKDSPYVQEHPPEKYVSSWVIRNARSDIDERVIRKILQILKLPEDHVITIKR
jgi:hypothetical protein